MNKVILMGRLTREPDIYDNRTVFNLAVDRGYKGKDGQSADFPRCVCFGKTKEFADNYLTKGIKIVVEGRISTGRKESITDGHTIYTTDIAVDHIEFAESKKADDGFRGVDESAPDSLPFQ